MNKSAITTFFGVLAIAIVAVFGYVALKPAPEVSAPIQAVALQSTASTATTGSAKVYSIDTTSSEARFVLDEVLRGEDKTVVGTTDQVAGQIALDPSSATSAQVGTITVNARTLVTDDSSRTRALQNVILSTGEHEYISFTPSAIAGLPTTIQAGQTYAAQLTGDLTIKGVTKTTTFAVQLTPTSASQLTGTANTTIAFADWGLSIPTVPFVASVDDQVRLELDFTANAA